MVATICFYISAALLGLFGLVLLVVSIASIIHNLSRNHRIKEYTKEQTIGKSAVKAQYTGKQHAPENTQYIANCGRPIVIKQSGYDNQKVTIGYAPNSSTLHVGHTVQANTWNSADEPKKKVQNRNQVMSKRIRDNSHENKFGPRNIFKNCKNKHGKSISRNIFKNYNKYPKI